MPGGEDAPTSVFAMAASDADACAALARRVLEPAGRVLLLGPPGCGKSTLARRLAARLAADGAVARCLSADPGSPAFGVPGAVCLGEWHDGQWRVLALEALCSLDAGRFRLPLAAAVRRLATSVRDAPLLVDGPGVVRGVAGAELLAALAEAARIDTIVCLAEPQRHALLDAELRALGLPVLTVHAHHAARRPGKAARARARTRAWDAYLADALVQVLDTDAMPVRGTPPPRAAREQWHGRQAALLGDDARTLAMGEVVRLADGHLGLRCARTPAAGCSLLIRNARREPGGLLGSAGRDAADAVVHATRAHLSPGGATSNGPHPVLRAGAFTATLVNGVLGDPLLHVRPQHGRRSLLFDLGESTRLPARLAHQVSDVFLSHAHMDHISGFLGLVRSRLGDFPILRLYGPGGIAAHLRGLLDGILWDRVSAGGPSFDVTEFDGARLRRVRLQAAGESRLIDERPAPDGVLLDEQALRVRATLLDHGHGTPVLAFALETPCTLKVRSERLVADHLRPGSWLTHLKQVIARGEREAPVTLPDGRESKAGALADRLLLEAPGTRLAYATDLADTEPNRAALAALAAGAHTLFCEATFRLADIAQARRTGHLTTRACGEIAERAGVGRLVPFHFSRRYEDDLAGAYDEVRAAFGRTMTPPMRDDGD